MWVFYAISAAVLWGLSYILTEKLMKDISMASVLISAAIGSFLFSLCLGLGTGSFSSDWDILKKTGAEAKLFIACILVYIAANIFILLSIKAKNATMAGMIEISYPLFTALFAWLLFRESQATAGTFMGAALIIAGIACIYFFDKTA